MIPLPIAIYGAGGYTGAALARLVSRHPRLSVGALYSSRLTTEKDDPLLLELPKVPVYPESAPLSTLHDAGISMVALCTPAEVSVSLAPRLLQEGVRVLDLSGAFRLRSPAEVAAIYGLDLADHDGALSAHAESLYRLPELAKPPDRVQSARLVINPGCYVTAAALSLAPLALSGLLHPSAPLFVDGKSGASGAGRKAEIRLSFCELSGDLSAYRLGNHQHTPEMRQLLGLPKLHFVPHLVSTPRGLLTTTHGQLKEGVTQAQVKDAYEQAFADRPLVHVVAPDKVSLRRPVHSPHAYVGIHVDPSSATFCALASLDNLLKGAASQAVQNLNAMLGLPDTLGLSAIWSPA